MGTIATMNVKLAMDSSDFESGIARAQQSAESMVQKLQKAGTAMSIGVTAPLVGIAGAAIASAADFEQSLNVMAQVSGATADQMAKLQAQALEMGAITSFSAGEAAQAQLELAKAGLQPVEVMQALPGVLDMAAAGGMGLAESAEIAANAMNAFNLPASEMGSVANMLAAAANASSVDISDLAMSMKMSGAVFAANKQPMDQMVAALAMLGNAGLKGSDAGTSLKTMMLSLASPTDKAYGAITDLGLAVYNADGSMRDFGDILNDLSGITATMSDEQRNVALSTIFGSDAIRAATILTRDYGKSWDSISDALGDGSAAANVAGARMKGMNGAIEYLKGSIDSFLIGAALPYLDALGNFVRMGADALTAFASMPRPLMDAAVAFGAVLAAAGPLMLAISGIGAAIGFLLSPVGLLVAAVAAVAAGFVLWQQNFGGVQQKAAALANTIKSMVESATGLDFDAIGEGVQAFGNYIGAVVEDGDYLNDWLTHLPESVQPAAQAMGQFVAAVGGLWQTGDLGAFAQEMRDLFPGAAAAVDTAIATITGALDQLSPIFQGIYDVMIAGEEPLGDWSYWWEQMSTVVGEDAAALISDLTKIAMGIAGVVGALLAGDLTGAQQSLGGLRESLVWLGKDLAAIDWGGIVTGIRDNLIGALGAIDWGGALATAGGWLDGLKTGVVAAIQSIPWGAALSAAGNAFGMLAGWVTAALQSIPWETALATAAGWLDALKTGVVGAIQSVDWGGALTAAGDFLASLWGGIATALAAIPWATALAGAATWLDGLKSGVVAAIQGIDWGGALTAAGDYLAGVKDGVIVALQGIDWAGALATAATWTTNLKNSVVAAIQGIDWAGALAAGGNVFAGLETAAVGALTALGFTGVTSALDGLTTAFSTAKSTLDTAWAAMQPIFAQIGDVMAPAVERLSAAFGTIPASFAELQPKLEALAGAFGGLVEAVMPLVAVVGGVLVIAANFGVNMFAAAIERLPAIVGPIIDQVAATVRTISTVITSVVDTVKAIAAGDWATAWDSLKTAVTALSTFIAGTWLNITLMMSGLGGAIGAAVTGTLNDLGLTEAATTVQSIIDKITELGTKIKAVLSGKETFTIALPQWLANLQAWTWPSLPATPAAWLATLLTWVWPGFIALPTWVDTLLKWVWPTFPSVPAWIDSLLDFDWPSFPAMPDWIGRLLGWAWPTLGGGGGGLDGNPDTPLALGGPASAGVPYLVGERGRELFIPNVSGQVIPHDELGSWWETGGGPGGGGVNIGQVTVSNEIDIRQLAYEVAGYMQRRR